MISGGTHARRRHPPTPPTYRDHPEPAIENENDIVVEVLADGLHHLTRAKANGSHYSTEMVSGMAPRTLTSIAEALHATWAADTCSPDDSARSGWSSDNPAWGHCDITALIINDIFGGDLMLGEVHFNGEQHGYHSWNRLSTGLEIDMTREQFRLGQVITAPRLVKRPKVALPHRRKEYLLLRERLASRLGPLPPPAESAEVPQPK